MDVKDGTITHDCGTDDNGTDYLVVFWTSELDCPVGECIGTAFSADIDGLGRADVVARISVATFRENGGLVGVWLGWSDGKVD